MTIEIKTEEHEGPCCESCLTDFESDPALRIADECCCRGIRTLP